MICQHRNIQYQLFIHNENLQKIFFKKIVDLLMKISHIFLKLINQNLDKYIRSLI